MEVVYPRCCGLDIHKKLLVACLLTPREGGQPRKEVRSFGAMTAAIIEAAHAAVRKKGSYLQAQYQRLAARRGKKKAAVAVGHSILVIVYHLLNDPERRFTDLGGGYFDEWDREGVQRRAVRRLESLGLKVTLEPTAA